MQAIGPRKVIDGVSTGTSITGATGVKALDVLGKKTASFHIDWTNTTAGEWKFLASNRPDAVALDGTVDITKFATLTNPASFSALQPAGSAGQSLFTFADLTALYLLPTFVRSNGTGVASAWGAAF